MESRPVLGNKLALEVVGGYKLEEQRGLHSICVNQGTICYICLYFYSKCGASPTQFIYSFLSTVVATQKCTR